MQVIDRTTFTNENLRHRIHGAVSLQHMRVRATNTEFVVGLYNCLIAI